MLRIEVIEGDEGAIAVHVEGKLAGGSVTVVEKQCRRLLEEGRSVRVDLSQVTYVDRDGVALLLELGDDDVVVAGSSAFIQEQLKRGRG